MDVGDHRQPALRANLLQGLRCRLIGHSTTHDFTTGLSQCLNLYAGSGNIAGIGIAHRLHRDRSVTANRHIANLDFACPTSQMATLKDETNPGKQLTQRRALKGKGKSQSDQNLLKLVLFSVLCVFSVKTGYSYT
jgi:hypothetical protein